MTFPTQDIDTSQVDAGADSPKLFRPQLKTLCDGYNALRGHFSDQGKDLINKTTPALAREVIAAQERKATLDQFGALLPEADQMSYWDTVNSMAKTPLTTLSRTLLGKATDVEWLAALGVVLTKFMTAVEANITFATKAEVFGINASTTWNPASCANGAQVSTTVTVAGAVLGDVVLRTSANIALGGLRLWGEVTAADTVTLYLSNATGAAVDLGSGTFYVRVQKR